MAPDKIDDLYDALKADGAVQKSKENFRNYMLAPGDEGVANRKALYEALKADGAVTSPTQEEFEKRLDIANAMGNASSETNGGNFIVNTVQDVASKAAAAMKPKYSSNSNDETLVGDIVATAKDAAAIFSGAPHIVVDGQHGAWNVIHNGTGSTNGGRPDLLESLNAYGNLLLLPQQKEMEDETPLSEVAKTPQVPGKDIPKPKYQASIEIEAPFEGDYEDLYYPLMKYPNAINVSRTEAYRKGWFADPEYSKNQKDREAKAAGYKPQAEKFKDLDDEQLVQAMREEEKKLDGSTSPEALQASMNVRYIENMMAAREWGLGSVENMHEIPYMTDYWQNRPVYNKNGLVDKYEKNLWTYKEDNPLLIRGWEIISEQWEKDKNEGHKYSFNHYRNLPFKDPEFAEEFGAYITARIKSTGERWDDAVKDAVDDLSTAMEEDRVGKRHSEGYLEKANREQVDDMLDNVNGALKRRMDQLDKKYDEQGWFARAGAGFGDDVLDNSRAMSHLSDPEYSDYLWAGAALRDAKKIINAFDNNKLEDGLTGFFTGAGRGLLESIGDLRTWDGGISDALAASRLYNAVDKYNKGKQLSKSEQALLEAEALKLATAAIFKEVGSAYKAGKVTGESLPFMAEMALNPISKAGDKIAKGLANYAKKHLGKYLNKMVAKLGRASTKTIAKDLIRTGAKATTKLIGSTVAAGLMSGTSGIAGSAANALGYKTGEIQYAEGTGGKTHFSGVKEGDDWVVSTLKGFGSRSIENASEMWGEYFAPVMRFLGRYGSSALDSMHLGVVNRWLEDLSSTQATQLLNDFRKQTRWDGVLPEYFEEVLGNITNALTVKDMNFGSGENGVFNWEDNLDTFLGVALMGGAMSTYQTATYRTPKYRAVKEAKRYDKMASDAFGKNWSTIKNLIDENSEEGRKKLVTDLMQSGKYNKSQKQIALRYAGAVYKSMGIDLAERKKKRRAGDQEASEAYGRGYNMGNLENIAETSSAYQQLRAQMEQEYGTEFVSKMDEKPGTVYGWLRSGEVNEEDAQKVLGYLNAKMAYEGAVDRINDDQAAAEAASDKHIDDRVNPEKDGGDGMIHPVVLKSGDKQVYVTNGQVVTNEDGTVDTKASTQSIVVVDEEDNVDMINPDAIDHVEDVIDPEQAKQAARDEMAAATQAAAEPEVDEMEDENATDEVEEDDVESNAPASYNNVLDAMGIEDEENRQAWNDYWAENAPEDAMDVLLDAQGVTDPAQRQRSKEYWQQNPKTFNTQWRYTMGEISSQAVNDAIAQGGTSESEADARNTQTPTATAQPQPQPQPQQQQQQQAAPSIAATSLGNYEQDDDVVLNVDGQQITGFISNVTPDGKLRLQLDAPINGNRVIDVTPEELDKMVAQPQASGEGDAALSTPQTEQPAAPAAPQPAQPGAASTGIVSDFNEPMPTKEVNGKQRVDYTRATPERAHHHIYNEKGYSKEEADQMVANTIAAKRKAAEEKAKALDAAIAAVPSIPLSEDTEDEYNAEKAKLDAARTQADQELLDALRELEHWENIRKIEDAAQRPAAVPADTGNTQTPPTPASTPSAPEGGETRMSSTESVGNQEQPATAERSEEEMTPDERIERAIKERIKARAKEIAEACGMPSHVIENIDDPSLPDSYRRKIKELEQKGEMVEGWYDTDTGHMYFYLPGIPNLDRLDEIYAHETVAHGGLRLLLRGKDGSDEEFNKLCDNVWSKMSVEARAERMLYVVAKHISPEDWKDAKKRNQAMKDGLQNQQYQREAADEYMAKLSEIYEQQKRNKKERGRIMQIIDAIRDAIKKHFKKEGVKLNINIEKTKDILDLLDKSRRKLTEMDAVGVSNQIDDALSNGEQDGANAANGMFSTTSIFEGAGFEVQQIDAEGNSVPMVDSKGNMIVKIGDQEFSAEHPVTVADLKPKKRGHETHETSVLQMLVEDAKNINGLSEKKADKIYQNYADILNMYLYMGSAEMGGPEAVERNWEWLGDTVFRTIAANGDDQYSYSMDIIRVCKKNEAVIKAMSAHQVLSGRGATPSEIVDIYRKTYVEGFQVPCPVCYVFTRYIRNGKYASAAIRGMETYGEHLPGGNDVWTAKQWADELDRLNRLTNSKYEVKGKETEAQKEKRVAEAKRFEKALEKANEITVKYEKRLNALSVELTSPGLTAEREQKIMDEIKVMDAQYQGAINVISYQALTNWIKTHAIEEKKGSGWKLRDDAQKPADINDYKANALDLRKTANTIVNYPAIQRLRKSGGSAAGKEISFASNNELGEVVSGLGINKTNLSTYANPYQMALNTDLDQKKRKEWRRKARDRFKDASTYAAMQTLRGGQRMWSWSDNIERLSPDVAINLIQLELLNGAMQTYSKQLEGVKLAAQMGAYVNGSLMAKDNGWLEVGAKDVNEVNGELWLNHGITDVVDEPQVGGGTEKRERVIAGAGSHVYQTEDGRLVVLQFDDIIGIDPYGNREVIDKDGKKKKAKGLFELNNELDKAGNILVGMNDLHIRAALADPRVFFVIPWHSSGANNHILAEMFAILEQRIDNSVDYTDMQEEKNMGTRNKDTKELPEVIQKLRDLWEEGRQWAEENGWAGGLEVDSNGDVMTESQYMYRQLRSLIFSGEIFKKMPTNAEYKKAVADAKAYNARLDEIQADLDRGGLTAEQKKALEKERDKIRPKRNEVQEIVDRHDGLIDWRDSAVHKDDAAWNAEHPKRINVEEARKMILADEFLKQVYNRVKPIGKMTNGDNTYIYPYEYWDENSTYDTADINGKRYVEYCRRMGYKPKFAGNWKTKDVSKQSEGDFVHDPGYWKLLIDRRMYDREGNYQWLDPVTSEDFNTDLINPMETQHEFHVTTVADDAAADSIASKVFEEESKTPGGFAHANYDKPLDKVVDDFEKAMEPGMMFSTSAAPTFYSNAERAVENIKQNKATAEQWLAMIKKNGGLKAGEDKWMGLSQWLEDNKGKSLTKNEVLQFVRDNGIQMEEVEYKGNIEDSPRFQELKAEYQSVVDNVEKVYQEAAKRLADFVGEMEEKYGDDYFEEMTPQEQMTYRILSREQEEADPTYNDPHYIAMREMVNRYGDDFEVAFGNGSYELEIDDEDAASDFLDEGWAINSTRLDYTTKGLENKREIAFVVPNVESYQENDEVHFGPENQGKAIMWVRFGETTDADGKRVLVIDEIQSNRHQDAREKGYKVDEKTAFAEYKKAIADYKEASKRNDTEAMKEAEKRYNLYGAIAGQLPGGRESIPASVRDAVPAAPFEKNWQEVAMKRMLRLAAEEGFDKVAWTTGEQQAKRYSLGRVFNSIEREDNPNLRDTKRFVLSGSNMETVVVNNEGMVVGSTLTDAIGKDLREVVGQSVAEKMMGLEDGDMLEGEDLRIGGEGMKGFYDNMLPRFMDKYGKRWGVKTGTVELPNVEEAGRTMHSVDVTPEMKESVMQGQMLFSTSEAEQMIPIEERYPDMEKFKDNYTILFHYKWNTRFLDSNRLALVEYGLNDLAKDINSQKKYIKERPWAAGESAKRELEGLIKLRENIAKELEQKGKAQGNNAWGIKRGASFTFDQFDELFKTHNTDPINAELWDKVLATSKVLGIDNIKVVGNLGSTTSGATFGGRVRISEQYLNSYARSDESKASTMLHEMIHHVTAYAVSAVKEGKDVPPHIADAVSRLNDIFNAIKNDPEFEGQYGKSDVDELVAELSNPEFREKLKKKNLWQKIVDGLMRLFGYEPRNKESITNAYAEARAALENLLENPDADLYNEYSKDLANYRPRFKMDNEVRFSTSAAVDALRDDERVYNDLLGKVFSGVSNETRRGIVEDAMRNRGYDFGAATEAWLSGLADDEAFAQLPQEDWRAVKDALGNALRENGVEGEMTDNEARYVLWKAGQIEDGMFSQAKDIVMQDELGLSNAQSTPSGVRFSTSPAEQIYSDNFKNWFGDWQNDPENASKVVDENGRPKVVYHQTNRKQYINKKTGQNWDDLDWRERDEWDNRSDEEWEDTWEEQDFYTFDNRYGRQSIEYPAFFFAPEEDPYHEYGKRTIAVYLDIKNPAIDPVIPDAGVSNTAGRDAMQALIDQGYDGVIRTEDGVPYEYIAFYPNQIKSATENNGDFSRENPDIRFSMSPRDRAIARDQYERWMSNSRMQWSEAMQDSMLGLKKLMQAIVGKQYKYIEDIPMNENPYVAENLMSSVTAAEQAAFYTEFMKPLMKAVGKLCKGRRKDRERKRQELTDYLMAKHGLERNLVFADRDAQETAAAGGNYQDAYNENRERDYSGLTALTDESDVHAAEAAAQQIVDNYEAQHDVTELWEKINAATKATLEKQYQSGILSKSSYEKIRDMFEYYVPLRGWDETTSDEVYGYLTSNAGPFLGGSIVKHAEGRTSKADDPIATISMMADDSIRTGNRNLMKQKFLNFVLNHPSDAVSVNELWLQYDDVKREWVPVFADIPADATAEEVEQIVAQFEQDMAQLAQQQPDKYKHGRETANIPYRVIPGNEREHQVLVKRRGQTYVLTINGNPRAAQALNGLTNPDVNIEGAWGSIIKGSEWVNRMLSALYTTLSPAFIVSNFLRDSFYSNNMVWVKEKGSWKLSKNYPLRFNYNYYKTNPAVLRWLLGKWENGTLDESKPIQKMFKEFMLHGGETGFAMAQDINDYKKKVNKELNGMNGRNYLKKAGSIVAEQYDLLGRSIENCARFAAFMTSRQMGRTVERAAFDAKEISVNFNKKGSGGRMLNQVGQTKAGNWGAFISGLARSVYTFWNAGVQGMANISRATKRNPFKAVAGLFTKWFGYGFFAPMLAAAMGAAAGGDDDDKNAYYNLPEYVRRSNICIWLGDAWLTLPLPIEFRAIYGLGELTYGVWSGNERYNNEELAMQYASQFSQVLPIDMLEGGGGFHPFIPTLLKPYVESEQNVSWSGIPIYKDSPYNQSDPDWTKAFSNTSGWLVASSEWLNAKTGGDEYKKGWLDPNPSKIEYLLKGYLGGMYSFPNDVMKAIQTATGDQEFEWRNIPLANRVIKEGDERLEAKKLRSDYFRYKEEYEETKRLLDKYEKAVKDGNSLYDYAKKLDILNNSKEYAHYEIFKNMDASMAPFREAAGKAESPEVVKQYEAMELKLMREMVDMINAYDDGKAVDPETAMRKVLMEVLDTATDEALKLEASKELAKSHGAKDGLGGSDTKYNQRYVALRNGTDVDEDAELQKARRNAKDLGNDALYKAYDRALDELATMRKGIHNKKKTVLGLGEGDADNDARIMNKIRTRRREVLDMSDEEVLEKFKPKK